METVKQFLKRRIIANTNDIMRGTGLNRGQVLRELKKLSKQNRVAKQIGSSSYYGSAPSTWLWLER